MGAVLKVGSQGVMIVLDSIEVCNRGVVIEVDWYASS